MSTFANAAFAAGSQPAAKPAVELDGASVRALAAALPAFAEKAPQAQLDQYIVHVKPPADGLVQIVFEPRQPEGAPPTLGGRTAAGAEVNVWVRSEDYTVERSSLAR
ncbi:hypothetical protein LDO32_15930 [Luteimonas sp. Y-2-2-4F]|nr:hypothetical protein [Luteimonas sp. Y-2-2-4F]MCD9033215.1 hypothetical protein [Luteimonas sp. Y-2-2-4F]